MTSSVTDGLTCVGEDACAVSNGGCAPTAACTSTNDGSVSCACGSGYTGNGIVCIPVDACASASVPM